MKLIVGNQKTYLEKRKITEFIESFKNEKFKNVIIIPSFPYLGMLETDDFMLGSQDVSIFESGNVTGEVTATQLKSLGVKYSLVGHSERRSNFNENEFELTKKIGLLSKNNIIPIFCIGETLEDRSNDSEEEVITMQINEVFEDFDKEVLEKIIIAYEPVWSIGTGITPSNSEIEKMVIYIKELIKTNYGLDLKVLYGGSVNANNIVELNKIESVDGYLIGKSSTDPQEFLNIIKSC